MEGSGYADSLTSCSCRTIPENVKSPVKARNYIIPRLHLAELRDFRRATRRGHADPHRPERAERSERDLDRRILVARSACAEHCLWRRPRRREDVEFHG